MKQEVTVKIPEFAKVSFADGTVTLTRAQVEAALEELNAPKFKTGDVVKHNDSRSLTRFVVLGPNVSGIVQANFPHLKNMKEPVTLMAVNAFGGTQTLERSEIEHRFEKVAA